MVQSGMGGSRASSAGRDRTMGRSEETGHRWVGSNQVIANQNAGGGAEVWDGTAPATGTEGGIEPRIERGLNTDKMLAGEELVRVSYDGGGAEVWHGTATATGTEGEIEPRIEHGLNTDKMLAGEELVRVSYDGGGAEVWEGTAAATGTEGGIEPRIERGLNTDKMLAGEELVRVSYDGGGAEVWHGTATATGTEGEIGPRIEHGLNTDEMLAVKELVRVSDDGGGAEVWDGTAPATGTEGEIEPRIEHGLNTDKILAGKELDPVRHDDGVSGLDGIAAGGFDGLTVGAGLPVEGEDGVDLSWAYETEAGVLPEPVPVTDSSPTCEEEAGLAEAAPATGDSVMGEDADRYEAGFEENEANFCESVIITEPLDFVHVVANSGDVLGLDKGRNEAETGM